MIDGQNGFAIFGASNGDLWRGEFIAIEGVERVSEFEANEIRHVDDIVDATCTACLDGAA